ncbi:MAG: GNAT family N-acetyltransferase [Dehalococcoidia bacterium]|nr:GNAT family N-acetyltransferase [Dehalococcoidia bacterium]
MDISFRRATPADAPAIRLVFGEEPSDEQLAMAGGDVARARRFRRLMGATIAGPAGLRRTTVAVAHGEVVGLFQAGAEAGDKITPALVWGLLRTFGFPGIVRFLRRDRLRGRVHISPPAGAHHIAEVHVLGSQRNRGIGAALMAEAERQARVAGARVLSLTTTTSNPARHLYERSGFRVTETREDPAFHDLTGVAGHILMVKDLE